MSALFRGVLAITLSSLAGCWVVGSIMVRGRNSHVTVAAFPSRDIQLETQDGVSIAGTFTPGRKSHSPAVLLLHGVGASRQRTAANAAWLASLGYATLAIDFRGHGQSGITSRTFGFKEALDVQAAFAWLKKQQNNAPVGIIGISLGGAASLLGDAGPILAEALVLQAVYPDIRHAIRNRIAKYTVPGISCLLEPWLSFQAPFRLGVWPSRLSPLRALSRYHGAVLIVGGEQDRSTPSDETYAMFAAARGDKTLFMVPTGDHAAICDLTSPAYRHHIHAFLLRTIGNADIAEREKFILPI